MLPVLPILGAVGAVKIGSVILTAIINATATGVVGIGAHYVKAEINESYHQKRKEEYLASKKRQTPSKSISSSGGITINR